MKKGFLIYKSLYEPIKEFSREQKGELLEAIFEYQISGEITEGLSPIVNMAFLFFKNQFDIDNSKYEERCEKAKKSAEYRWKKKEENKMQTDANAYERMRKVETDANNADKRYKIEDTRYKIQDTSKKIEDTSNKLKGVSSISEAFASPPTLEERKVDFYLSVKVKAPEVGMTNEQAEAFADYWTEHNEGGNKMRFEKQKTFSLKSRMSRWTKNEFSKPEKGNSTGGTVTGFMNGL